MVYRQRLGGVSRWPDTKYWFERKKSLTEEEEVTTAKSIRNLVGPSSPPKPSSMLQDKYLQYAKSMRERGQIPMPYEQWAKEGGFAYDLPTVTTAAPPSSPQPPPIGLIGRLGQQTIASRQAVKPKEERRKVSPEESMGWDWAKSKPIPPTGMTSEQFKAQQEGTLINPSTTGELVFRLVSNKISDKEWEKWITPGFNVTMPIVGTKRFDLKGLADLSITLGLDPLTYFAVGPVKNGTKELVKAVERAAKEAKVGELLTSEAGFAGRKIPKKILGEVPPAIPKAEVPVVKLPPDLKKSIESLSTVELEKRVVKASPHKKLYRAELDRRALPKVEVPPIKLPETPIPPPSVKPPPIKPLPIKPPKPPVVVPAEPVIKPNGRLWLPEPPRTAAEYIPSVRKEMASKFRGKTGVFDTIEQANQMVLKSRDMGKNTIPYVSSYIRRIGNTVDEFGIDASGMATKIGNPEGRSLAINDVLSNYTHYTLTPKQLELAKAQGFVYQEALKLAKSYGVKIDELGNADELWQYIARRVKSKLNPLTGKYETPPGIIGGFKMGAKIGAQKQRVFDEMLEGVDLGLLYDNPDRVLAHHIQGIYRLIGNKQAEELVTPLTRAITKTTPLTFGERVIAEPALKQRAAAVEVANAIDKMFAYSQVPKPLKILSDISGAMVGQVAAFDLSAPLIQGLPILGHDLKMGLMGKQSNVWAKTFGAMWKSGFNPERINTFRAKNPELYKRAIQAGVQTGDSEFVSGVGTAQRGLGKIPVIGKTIKEAYRQSWGRMGQAYSDFLEISRIRMFEQLEPIWQKNGQNLFDLGLVTNRMTGTISATARGVSPTRQAVERIAFFAPNYLRASLVLMKDLMSSGAKAREVQMSLATVLGVGAAVYYAEEKLRGQEPKMKPWTKRLGGDGADAFTTVIGDTRVGLGSWMYGMIKTLADVTAIAIDDPSALIVWNQQHPVARFVKSKTGPALSLVTELATGKNFYGQSFNSPNDYLIRIAESLTPISAQPLVGQKPKGGVVQSAVDFGGMRSYPYTPEGILSKKSKLEQNVFGETTKRTTPWFSATRITNEQSNAVATELNSLEFDIGFAGNTVSTLKLVRDEQYEYQETSGQMIRESLSNLIRTDLYKGMTPKEKTGMIERIVRKQRDKARDILLQGSLGETRSNDDKTISFNRALAKLMAKHNIMLDEVEDEIWKRYSPELRLLSDYVTMLETTNKPAAEKIHMKNHSIIQARSEVANAREKVMHYNPKIQRARDIWNAR